MKIIMEKKFKSKIPVKTSTESWNKIPVSIHFKKEDGGVDPKPNKNSKRHEKHPSVLQQANCTTKAPSIATLPSSVCTSRKKPVSKSSENDEGSIKVGQNLHKNSSDLPKRWPTTLKQTNKTSKIVKKPEKFSSQPKLSMASLPASVCTARRATVGNEIRRNVNVPTKNASKGILKVNKNIPKKPVNSTRMHNELRNQVKREEKQQFLNPVSRVELTADPNENQIKKKKHTFQEDIDFVPDERFRKLILSGKELTPGILKSCSTIKSQSMYERFSFFKKMPIPRDPHKEALKAIENANLAEEERRVSQMKMPIPPFCLSPKFERPSLYKNMYLSNDPHKEALRAIENADLVEEERRVSQMKMPPSGFLLSPAKFERGSLYRKMHVNPHQEILKAIENTDLAAEDRRISQLKKQFGSFATPFKEGNNMCNPFIVDNPHEEALKKLAEFQSIQRAKSARKVTFNLVVSDSNPKKLPNNDVSKKVTLKTCLSSASKSAMKNTIFKSENVEPSLPGVSKESNKNCQVSLPEPAMNSLSAVSNETDTLRRKTPDTSHYKDMLLRVCKQRNANISEKCEDFCETEFLLSDSNGPSNPDTLTDKIVTPAVSSLNTDFAVEKDTILPPDNSRSAHQSSTVKRTVPSRSNLISERIATPAASTLYIGKEVWTPDDYHSPIKEPQTNAVPSSTLCHRTLDTCLDSYKDPPATRDCLSVKAENTSKSNFDKITFSKICTPKPISLYHKAKLTESNSPEFFSSRKSNIIGLAPINTPLVLRCLARDSERELSPVFRSLGSTSELNDVCQRLNFDDALKEENDSEEASPTSYFQGIFTAQKMMDNLADQECDIFMMGATFPVSIRPYICNPVAHILNDGDETNFVPLKSM